MGNEHLNPQELDAIVSEKVFGRLLTWNRAFQYLDDEERKTDIRAFVCIPEYSTTWDGMRLVVEEMQRRGWEWAIWQDVTTYNAEFSSLGDGRGVVSRFADTAPHAVCLAALSALQHVSHTDGLGDRDD